MRSPRCCLMGADIACPVHIGILVNQFLSSNHSSSQQQPTASTIMSNRDYYADLGLRQYANSSEIKQAFHALAKKHHPDKTGNDDASAFRMVHEAYEKLSDTAFRAKYDRTYVGARMEFDTDEVPRTRTAAYEAEEAEREAREERAAGAAYQDMLRRSPPPKMPVKKSYESGTSYYLGKAYTAWEKRDAAYRLAHPWYDPV
jgi:curved DNA-binding protein CbpA